MAVRIFPRRSSTLATGGAALREPFARGLVAAFAPGIGNAGLTDLVSGLKLAPGSGAILGTAAGTAGLICPTSAPTLLTCPTRLKITPAVTILARMSFFAAPAANAQVFGVTANNTGTSPFVAYALSINATGFLRVAWSNGAIFAELTGGAYQRQPVVGRPFTMAGLVTTGGVTISFGPDEGAATGSVANPSYSVTSEVQIGGGGGSPNVCVEYGLIYNRRLSPAELKLFRDDPYHWLRPAGAMQFALGAPPPTEPEPPPSGLTAKYLTFTKQGAVGLQTITGVGFEGKALLLWSTRQTVFGPEAGATQLFALTDGVAQGVLALHHPGGEPITTSAQVGRSDCLIYLTNATSGGAPTVEVRGEFGAWTADGFTLDWTVNDGAATVFHAIVLGGSDSEIVLKQSAVTVGAPGSQVVTGIGFKPDSFIVLSGGDLTTGGYAFGAPYGGIQGFGFSNALENALAWTVGRGTGGPADTYRGLHDARVASDRDITTLAEIGGVRITATHADGFTLTRVAGSSSYEPMLQVLCIKGAEFTVGTFSSPASPGDLLLSLPFEAGLLIVETHQSATINTAIAGLSLMVGAWVTQSGQGGTWIGGTDAASPSVYQRASYTGRVIQARDDATLDVTCDALVTGSTETGITLTFSIVPAPAITFTYLAAWPVIAPFERARFRREDFTTGRGRILAWIDLYHRDAAGTATIFKWGTYNLQDPATYTGGKKDPRLVSIGYTDRALTDSAGTFRGGSCFVRFVDQAERVGQPWQHHLRAWLDSTTQYGVINAEAIVWVISEADWRLRKQPIQYFHGRVGRYVMDHGRLGGFELKDVFELPFARPIPLPALEDDFPTLPDAARELHAPLVLGAHSDEGSAEGTLTFVVDEAGRGGAVFDEDPGPDPVPDFTNIPMSSYGDIGLTPPSGLVVTEALGGGNLYLGNVPDDEFYVFAVRVVDGVRSDPNPFLDGVAVAITADGSAVHASCDLTVGTDAYEFYLCANFSGDINATQVLSTTDPVAGVTFTDQTAIPGDTGINTPGAGPGIGSPFGTIAALAVLPEGRTSLAPHGGVWPYRGMVRTTGYLRPGRICWTPVAGALRYELYLSLSPGDVFTRQWTIPVTQLNSNGDVYWESADWLVGGGTAVSGVPAPTGKIPTVYLGRFTDDLGYTEWHGLLVSYGVVTEIAGVYQNGARVDNSQYGVNVAVPGQAGFSPLFGAPYVTRNGRRYSLFYVRGGFADGLAAGTTRYVVNVVGIEDVGDGSGDPILDGYDQLAWLLDNWWLRDVPQPVDGGNWQPSIPTFADGTPKRDEDTFAQAAADALELMAAGLDRAIYLPATATPPTGLTLLRDVLLSLDAAFGQNLKGQAVVYCLPPPLPNAVGTASLTQIGEILDEAFEIDDDAAQRANVLTFSYDYNEIANRYDRVTTIEDVDAQEAYNDALPTTVAYRYVRDGASAGALAQRALARVRKPARTVRTSRFFHAIHDDLGARLYLTHPEGAAASGFVRRLVQVRRVEPDHDAQLVRTHYWDLEYFETATVDTLLEETMADLTLGGHRHNSCVDGIDNGEQDWTGQKVPYDYRLALIPWARIPGWSATARVHIRVASDSATPRVYNLTDAEDVDSGTAHTGALFGLQEIAIPRPADNENKEYMLLVDGTAGATDIFVFGEVRLEPTTLVRRSRR